YYVLIFFFFSSRRRHTRSKRDWSSDVCSSDLIAEDIKGEFQSELVVKTEVINGFVNFHIDKLKGSSLAVNEIGRDGYGKTQHLRSEERRVGKECRIVK